MVAVYKVDLIGHFWLHSHQKKKMYKWTCRYIAQPAIYYHYHPSSPLHLHLSSPSGRNLIILLKYASSLQGRGIKKYNGSQGNYISIRLHYCRNLYFFVLYRENIFIAVSWCFVHFILLSLSLKTRRESSRHPPYSLAYCKELKYGK